MVQTDRESQEARMKAKIESKYMDLEMGNLYTRHVNSLNARENVLIAETENYATPLTPFPSHLKTSDVKI